MKKVILFSAGMDSHMLAHAFPDATLLFIDSGARYTEKELASIKKTAPREPIIVRNVLDLSQYERDDAIVPARNLLLATVASYYGDQLIIGATAGDNSTDKDAWFAELAATTLNHIYSCSHFNRPKVSIELPFKNLSKGQMLDEYLLSLGDLDTLINTTSCYSDVDGHCGQCKACIRKWTAFVSRGIDIESIFTQSPIYFDWTGIAELIESGKGWRCADEDAYTMEVLTELSLV
jgi:7-cyano-7-deazaguanine synthase in queuosine biosynthesis